jgi:hypothetical protein
MPDMEQSAVRYRTLDALVDQTELLDALRKTDLEFGDRVLVTTNNSTYSIHVLREGLYSVSGGWFDRQGLSPLTMTINGCTWGGTAIKLDIMAACGLHLEFGNRVVTSKIKKFHVVRCQDNSIN